MSIPLYQVDVFTDRVFGGNPAAVCPLRRWLPDELMQNIAAENNLSETAFVVSEGDRWRVRWFTPTVEVDLCGHATLAAAWVVLQHLQPNLEVVEFETRCGPVSVRRDGRRLQLDFPSWPGEPIEASELLVSGLGHRPQTVLRTRDLMVVFDNERQVRALKPDFARLAQLDCLGILATAPAGAELAAQGVDFVSRSFFPAAGVDEDPVCGSAHCTLVPYWAERLGKRQLLARHASCRGGEIWCELSDQRVLIAGQVVPYLRGTLHPEIA